MSRIAEQQTSNSQNIESSEYSTGRCRIEGNAWKFCLLAILALLTAWRQPGLLYSPRFWAEEGSLYFCYAYSHSFIQNLLHAELGYYTLYHSLVTSLATLFPLELAPTVTTYAAFLVQIGIGCLILWGETPLLDSRWKRAAVLFLIPLVCYARNWLNTLGIHFWFGILSFFLLIETHETPKNQRDLFRNTMLALAGLTGVTTCFMTPVFILKAFLTRSRRFIRYSLILSACSLIQMLVFIDAWQHKAADIQLRFVYNAPVNIVKKVLIYQFAEPFLGHAPFEHPVGLAIGRFINGFAAKLFGASPFTWELEAAATLAGLCIFLFMGGLFCLKFREREYRYVICAFLLVWVLSTILSLNMSAGPRYTFAPNAMLIVFAVSLWNDARLKAAAKVVKILVFFSLIVHLAEFQNSMLNLAYDENWPQWKNEVRLWRTVPGYRPRIWPPGWDMWFEK